MKEMEEDKGMKGKIWTVIGGIGMILLLAGASAMDSETMVVPVIMTLAGLTLCCISARKAEHDEA